jgi:predicted polyphosphate/ATP-dependent NAD kinase
VGHYLAQLPEKEMKKLGLIVNPVAGMGGRVGLKGTDGKVAAARALGAVPRAGEKAARALTALAGEDVVLVTLPGVMGADAARQAGVPVEVVDMVLPAETTRAQTLAGAGKLQKLGVDLILFAGGDGTARDIYTAVGETLSVIGIPAGVKIYSPVFASTPAAAGYLAQAFVRGQCPGMLSREVLDIDETAYARGRVLTDLFGCLQVPDRKEWLQGRKTGSPASERQRQHQIARTVIHAMVPETCYLIGPGSTPRAIMAALNLDNTLLGVDLVLNQTLLQSDVNEADILTLTQGKPMKIIITPIGGQGALLGRGNLPISPRVIQRAGKANIQVVASLWKMGTLKGRPFFVDTCDRETDQMLSGYIRVITGYRQEMIYPVQSFCLDNT